MYAEVADIEARWTLAELLIVANDGEGGLNTGYVTTALTDASEEIDSALQEKYKLPLPTPYPAMLTRICCDIAMYRMSTGPGRGASEEKERRFDESRADLDRLATGKRRLAEAPEPPTQDEPRAFGDKRGQARRRFGRLL